MNQDGASQPRPKRRDFRVSALLIMVALMALIGTAVHLMPAQGVSVATQEQAPAPAPASAPNQNRDQPSEPKAFPDKQPSEEEEVVYRAAPDPSSEPQAHEALMKQQEVQQRLEEAKQLMQKGDHSEALQVLNRAVELLPHRSPIHVSKGYAHLELGQLESAQAAFTQAIDLNSDTEWAYFGLGIVYEQTGDLVAAMGAMRSFLHVTKKQDPYAKAVTQARSALWEWEAKLGKGRWGETRGIPPGLTASDVKRDGQGIGILKPLPDGTSEVVERPDDHDN